ncbi:YbfB/YjiJ family MFS transporter [Pantoea sp. LMR881]|uniref:YbfB/YjiJ family MFS transporter n=1 Tax=Pantoea sp. LMR881 TaxID=3014336 RepID=UPI003FA7EBE4
MTSWTQLRLGNNNAPRLSAAVFTGPGVGITLTGVLAWLMACFHFSSSYAWYIYGAVALIISLLICRALPAEFGPVSAHADLHPPVSKELKKAGGYLLSGRVRLHSAGHLSCSDGPQRLPGRGSGRLFLAPVRPVCCSRSGAGDSFAARFNTQRCLAAAMMLQGVGVAASVVMQSTAGLLLSTVLTGLGFLSIMQLTMRFAREISTGSLARMVGLLTSGYATGQLAGPLLSSASVAVSGTLNEAIILAAAGLIAGGVSVMTLIQPGKSNA